MVKAGSASRVTGIAAHGSAARRVPQEALAAAAAASVWCEFLAGDEARGKNVRLRKRLRKRRIKRDAKRGISLAEVFSNLASLDGNGEA